MKMNTKNFSGEFHRFISDEKNGIYWFIFSDFRKKPKANITQLFKNKKTKQTIVGVGYSFFNSLKKDYNL